MAKDKQTAPAETTNATTEPMSDSIPIIVVDIEPALYGVSVFVEDSTTKRGRKKATDVQMKGTLPDVANWLAKQIAALEPGKINSVTRIEINKTAEAESEKKLTF